ncbi:MAG: tRNA 2-thiouridine(34) synthase MnmA [Proteobacteria bacterium]|nr:tRNA 2-thiouridine(34) synthase MnmA [Pseudomonadota bacterium]
MNKRLAKIVVGLSGGVDSSVSALLLKEQGYEVCAIFMQNWENENQDPYCRAEQDLSDARAVCDRLQVPFHVVNFAKEYWDRVFQYCLDEFAAGRTPNPDIWCNKEIKFKVFLAHALKFGDALATGHYAQIREDSAGHLQLLKGADPNKDQSYFLYTLGQYELSRSLFPVGHWIKQEVRAKAQTAQLLTSSKKDSTGICFIGERRFKQFLSEFLLAKHGLMVTPEGENIGEHDGLMFYTIGQRQGLKIGGRKQTEGKPWFVVAKNIAENKLIVVQGHDHPLLYAKKLTCNQVHWVKGSPPPLPLSVSAKIRYRQIESPCQIKSIDSSCLLVTFEQPQWAITPGQSIVFYQNEICLGGATIISQ